MGGSGDADRVLASTVRRLGIERRVGLLQMGAFVLAPIAAFIYLVAKDDPARAPFPPILGPIAVAVAAVLAIVTVIMTVRTRQRLGLFHRHREYDLVVSGSLAVSGPFEVARSFSSQQVNDQTYYDWTLQVFKAGAPVVTLIERQLNPPDDGWSDPPRAGSGLVFHVIGESCVFYLSERLDGAAPKPLEDSPPAKTKKKKKKPSAASTA
jgi:hypothetical protein